ncbi:MAG: hypothetical protein ACREJT_00685 [Myxococcota bacterium]
MRRWKHFLNERPAARCACCSEPIGDVAVARPSVLSVPHFCSVACAVVHSRALVRVRALGLGSELEQLRDAGRS